jgi:hypothetical protein
VSLKVETITSSIGSGGAAGNQTAQVLNNLVLLLLELIQLYQDPQQEVFLLKELAELHQELVEVYKGL